MRLSRVKKKTSAWARLARQLRQMNVQLRFVPPANFLRTAVEGYLKSKREQRL